MAQGSGAVKKCRRDIYIGIGVLVVVVIVFLIGSGRMTLKFPFSFALVSRVEIRMNPSDRPEFGGDYQSSLGSFDVALKGRTGKVRFDKVTFALQLQPRPREVYDEGLHKIRLDVWSCGQSPGYGYVNQGCRYETYYLPDTSVERFAGGHVRLTFNDLGFTFIPGAKQGFSLHARLTRNPEQSSYDSNSLRRIMVELLDNKKDSARGDQNIVMTAGDRVRIELVPKNLKAALRVSPGYGLPQPARR